MPNGGGGGGGGLVGLSNSFTGASSSIDTVLQFAYAYSGKVPVDNNETTLIQSTTGNFLFVGTWQPQYMVTSASPDDYLFQVYLNDNIVASVILAASADRDSFYRPVNLIIPAYTAVKMTAANVANTNSRDVGGILTGRTYRG